MPYCVGIDGGGTKTAVELRWSDYSSKACHRQNDGGHNGMAGRTARWVGWLRCFVYRQRRHQ